MVKAFDKRNLFDLSHEHKLTCDMGKLVPVLAQEVLPGDTIKLSSDMVLRLAPMVAPMMHNVNVYTHFFFVPNRLLMDKWEQFITGGKNNDDATVMPYITAPVADSEVPGDVGGFPVGSLADYLGMPTGVPNLRVSALPFRAYAMIYNQWYRDENLIDEVGFSDLDGADTTTNTDVLNRAWSKDYFTNCLPWPQRGSPVYLPLGTTAPVVSNNKTPLLSQVNGTPNLKLGVNDAGDGYAHFLGAGNISDAKFGSESGLSTDLSQATSITVDSLRMSIQVQQYAYMVGRGGYRYVEWLKQFFGVTASDARLQRPEYLGGGRSPIMVSEVLQTSSTDNTSPQGNMSGHGISAGRTHEFTKSFEEHGIIIGIMSIMPRASYQQGLYRGWSRATRYDFYTPVFAHLGEQGVLNKEIYAQGTAVDDELFGYQSRYDEYRQLDNQVHGQFRTTLDSWHMGRKFDNLPTLSSAFVNCTPTKRVFAVPSEDCCLVDIYHRIKAIRPIPKFGNPGLMDHY